MKPAYNIVAANHVSTVVARWKMGVIHEWGSHAELTTRPMMTTKQTTRLTLELERESGWEAIRA